VLIGSHLFTFQKKGYVSQSREYTLERNQVVRDTVELLPIEYFKKFAFYFGGGYTLRGLSGVTGILGATYHGHDIQLSYTFGLSSSKAVNTYDASGNYQSRLSYKMNSLGVKYGYQILLTRKIAITPQVGFVTNMLAAKLDDGSQMFADGASCKTVTVGAKFLLVPVKHVCLFAAPEFGIAMGKDNSFDLVSKQADFSQGGFAATLGILATF
jgi:hypothetical protein